MHSIGSYAEVMIPTKTETKTIELCDMIVTECEKTIGQQDKTIKLLEDEVSILKNRKERSNWLLWLLGGIVAGTVLGNGR